jgi:hypothetical protein
MVNVYRKALAGNCVTLMLGGNQNYTEKDKELLFQGFCRMKVEELEALIRINRERWIKVVA